MKDKYFEIKKIIRECLNESILEEKEKIYSGREVNRYIKDITPEESDIPDYFMNNFIAPRKFRIQKVKIGDLLKSDPSFKEYYDSEDDRYEDEEYMDHNDLYNYATIVDGEVMDGYNRMSVLKRGGEDFVDAYVALPKK